MKTVPLAVARTLLRRQMTRSRQRPVPRGSSSVVTDKFAKLSEAERAQVSHYLDQWDAEAERKLAHQVDVYLQSRPTFSKDAGIFNRVLTFFRVPKDERRARLLWRSKLTGLFLMSWAVGDWQARTCLLEQQEEEITDNTI